MTKAREFMTFWEREGHQLAPMVWSRRTRENMIGTAKGKRYVPKLRPFDLLTRPNQQVVMFANDDMRAGVESVVGTGPYFSRNSDFDEMLFQFAGTTKVETEFGVYEMTPGELMIIPNGIAFRSVGGDDGLRVFVRLHSPITGVLKEDVHTSRTRYEVTRVGGPRWTAQSRTAEAASLAGGRVLEKLFIWEEDPADATEIERDPADLVGVSSPEFDGTGPSPIVKMRPFDIFTTITGKGAGPKILESANCIIECFNTVGDQSAFHRAMRTEEFGLQFQGTAENVSEYEKATPIVPGEMMLIPIGIGHAVQNCSKNFRRIVWYSNRRLDVLVDPSMQVGESRFEVKETVIEPGGWHKALAAL